MELLKWLSFAFMTALPLSAELVVYEGFNPDDEVSGVRTGMMTSWHRLQGEVGVITDSVPMPGLKQSSGALILEQKGEALAQLNVDVTGTYYGGFRIRSAVIVPDTLLCLVLARPDLEELTPKTANISIVVKGWRTDQALILLEGKSGKPTKGVPIQAKEPYLVLFKVQDGSYGQPLVESWILNSAQAEHFANSANSEVELNAASLGSEPRSVMQRLSLQPQPSSRLSLSKGDVIACMAKFNPKSAFDEIRISTSSLREAAGAPVQ